MRRALATSLVLTLGLMSQGCVTTSQGRQMRRDILALQAQFDELRSEKELLKETTEKAAAEIRKLEEANRKATELLRRNSADFGVQIDQLRVQIAKLQGRVETLEHRVELLEEAKRAAPPQAAEPAQPQPAPLPEDKAALYSYGYEKLGEKDYQEARRAFKEYVTRYPKDKRADNALYFWGESFFLEGMFTEAVQVFQRILTDYSKGDKVDDTLFRIGEVFERLGKCDDARVFYEELLDKHAKSPLVKKTRKKLKKLKRRCK